MLPAVPRLLMGREVNEAHIQAFHAQLCMSCLRRSSTAQGQWEQLMVLLGGEYAAWAKIPTAAAQDVQRLEF